MIRAVGQDDADVDRLIAGEHARGDRLLDALVDRGDVLLGNDTTGDLVLEDVAATGPGGLEGVDHVAVLALAAGLTDVLLLDLLDGLANGLAVGDLGLTDVGVHRELAQHAVHHVQRFRQRHLREHLLSDEGLGRLRRSVQA